MPDLHPFDHDALAAQVQKLPTLPAEEAHVGVVAHDGEMGVEAEGSKYIGKGWSAAAAFEWVKKTGWSTVAGLNWKGGSK